MVPRRLATSLTSLYHPSTSSRSFSVSGYLSARGSRKPPQQENVEDYLRSGPVVQDEFPQMYKPVNREELQLDERASFVEDANIGIKKPKPDFEKRSQTSQPTTSVSSDFDIPEFKPFVRERDQAKKISRPSVEPKLTSVVLFPGQGSQFVGMGAKLLDFLNVRDIYNVASSILNYDLLKMCLNGPKEDLDKTVHCQLAVFVTSIAALEKLKVQHPVAVESCAATAGFSVGEFAALVFAGCLSFEQGVKLVKVRAEAMQAASETVASGMLSVLVEPGNKLTQAMEIARKWCKEKKGVVEPVCSVANYLFPEGRVIAGNLEALDFIEANAKQFGIKPLKRLPVSGAFHTPLMSSARETIAEAVDNLKLRKPTVPVLSNVTGVPYSHPAEIKRGLVKQVDHPVKWEQTLHCVFERKSGQEFPQVFECGPGKQLGAMLKRVNAKAFSNYVAVEV